MWFTIGQCNYALNLKRVRVVRSARSSSQTRNWIWIIETGITFRLNSCTRSNRHNCFPKRCVCSFLLLVSYIRSLLVSIWFTKLHTSSLHSDLFSIVRNRLFFENYPRKDFVNPDKNKVEILYSKSERTRFLKISRIIIPDFLTVSLYGKIQTSFTTFSND